MCGFAGYFYFDKQREFDSQNILSAMGRQIAHRGPDGNEIYFDQQFGVNFRRLAIVDLKNGSQPIFNEDRSIVMVVNGEVFNYKELKKSLEPAHRFHSESDCEVLIHLYEEKGTDFLTDVNGMFALCIWDIKNNRFLLARDRMGIKPLYYSFNNDRLLFGSEIKSLFPFPDCPRNFNWFEALDGTKKLHIDDDYHLETYFQGIEQIKGGQLLTITADKKVKIEKYWDLLDNNSFVSEPDLCTEGDFVDFYYEILADSTKKMLLGDVEIGLFLSGGIDSSIIAALAAGKTPLKTFSVFNDDTVENGDALAANEVANFLGITNFQLKASYNPNIHDSDYWRTLVWHCETYECGTEQLFKNDLHKFVKSHFPNLKVILLGQGSDEFNGGYAAKYVNELNALENNRWNAFEQLITMAQVERNFFGVNKGLQFNSKFINPEYVSGLKGNSADLLPYHSFINGHAKGLQLYQLLHEDRTAMANGIENRVPFLDHRLVELITTIPKKFHEKLFWDKKILRRGALRLLPKSVCNRKKVPFIFDNKNNYSRKVMYDIFTRNGNELLNYALGNVGSAHEVLNRTEIEKLVIKIGKDKSYSDINELRFLANMGILSKMTNETEFTSFKTTPAMLSSTYYSNRSRCEQEAFEIEYHKASESFEDKSKQPKYHLANDVEILTDLQGTWYFFHDEQVVDVLLEDSEHMVSWILILKDAFYNKHTVSDSISHAGFTIEQFSGEIKRFMTNKLLTIIPYRLTTQS